MHMDFFDRTMLAIDNGFYLEAIFREHAAIEGRLEAILGILGAPCNKYANPTERRKVNISHRINCMKRIYKSVISIGNTKLDAILGQNAVGKTTLIRTLMRELPNYQGSVKVGNSEIGDYSIRDYAKKIGVVSTASITFQNLLVADYLVTGFLNQMDPFSKPNNEYVKNAFDTLADFGKQELFNKQIDQLSSGEKQIVMIARVLLQNPEIIVFDEPTANLDVKNQLAVLNQIQRLSKRGYTIIVTTHNPGHAYSLGGKTLIMGKGKYRFGESSDIITEHTLSEYYELEATMQAVTDYQCIAFADPNSSSGIKLIF